jgi:hypothetical protein
MAQLAAWKAKGSVPYFADIDEADFEYTAAEACSMEDKRSHGSWTGIKSIRDPFSTAYKRESYDEARMMAHHICKDHWPSWPRYWPPDGFSLFGGF